MDGVELRFVGTELKVYEPGVPVRLPPREGEGGEDFPPVVIASPEERILAVGFRFSYPTGDSPATQLSRHVEREGLVTGFRINGKYRDYTLTIGGGGYEEAADGSPLPPLAAEPILERELHGARLTGEDLRKADLAGRDLQSAVLTGSDLRGAKLVGANMSGADLAGADLREADLTGADLHGATLAGADLRGADVSGAGLRGATLTGADLREADLGGAGLHEADLRGADLRGADLDRADFAGADLGGANLEGAKLGEANLGGVVWTERTRWPEGFGRPPDTAS